MSKLTKRLCEEFGIPDVGAPAGMNSVETVNTKIDRAEKMEEVDTVTFGLETDDGRIIKVYVKAQEADDFEEALSKQLGVEDVIEDVLNKLSKDFDIIDVEWPDNENSDNEETEEDDELSVDDIDMDDEENDGSESMNKKAWGKNGKEKSKHLVKKESNMSYGQLFTQKLLDEGKRFVTVVKGKEKVFMAFDEKTANNMAKKWGGTDVKPFKGHNTGGAKKKVTENHSEFNNVDDIVDKFGKDKIMKWLNGDENNQLQNVLYDYYFLSGEMPYGVAKARTGDPDNWIADRFPDDLADAGYIEKKTHRWIAKENMNEGKIRVGDRVTYVGSNGKKLKIIKIQSINGQEMYKLENGKTIKGKDIKLVDISEDLNEFKYGGPADDEAEVVKQPGGKRYKVGGLDSRFSTIYQFMIYQALLDLGIPDEALVRAPQKNIIVTSIRDMARELQKDPVRRQALRFLINRLKETTDVVEAKEVDEKDAKVSEKEKKEAAEMKVGQLDDRFVTVIQKLLYQTILMLGLPDSFMVKSSYKNAIVNSIKNKAKEFQKDSVKRSALRIFTHRFETKTNEGLSEEYVPQKDKWGRWMVTNGGWVEDSDQRFSNEKAAQRFADKLNKDAGYKVKKNVNKKIQNEERLDENVGSDTVDFITNLLNKLVPEDKAELVSKLEDTSAWQQVRRAITSNTKVNQVVSPIRQNLISISKKMSGTGSTFQEQLDLVNEAKWGDEPMLDDPEDQPADKDAKVKLPRRKKDKRAGEEAEWEIKKVKKTGELKITTDGLEITLDDESTEKLIKAIANKSIAVLPDSDISGTKWVFSPRARTYMVKKAGAAIAEKPLILSWADTNSIEDIYLGK